MIIQNIFLAAVSPRQKGVRLLDIFNEAVRIGDFTIGWLQIITTITCFVALGILTLFLRRSTRFRDARRLPGFSGDATDGDPGEPRHRRRGRDLGALAGVAAIFILARRGTVEPTMGFIPC